MTTPGRKGKRLTQEDLELWQGVLRSVKPMRRRVMPAETGEVALKEPPSRKPAARPLSPAAIPVKPAPSKGPPAIAPIEKRLKQKLARGGKTIDARLDLHGHSQAEAHDALFRFLRRTQSRGGRVALVITGKGGRDSGGLGGGVLRRSVPMWLALPEFRALVIGFDAAAPAHGGDGALYVRIRRVRET